MSGITIQPTPIRRPSPSSARLTPRESEAVSLCGLHNREIAFLMEIEVSTVKTLLNRAFPKLGAETRTQAVLNFHKLQGGTCILPFSLPLAGGGGENPAQPLKVAA